jgi:magnesium-transporting ATPase (P-type)
MNLSRISKAIAVVAIFLVSTIVLYLFYTKGFIPDIIFYIGFGIVILVCVYIMLPKPTKREWKNFTVIPIKRHK